MKKTYLALSIALMLLVGLDYLNAWTTAPTNPPADNAPAPINTSAELQDKEGLLSLGGLAVFGGVYVTDPENPSASTTLGAASIIMDIEGRVGADAYCDRDGENCWDPATGPMISESPLSGGSIKLTLEYGETSGDIALADTFCRNNGHDGVWAAIDRTGSENVICFDSTMVESFTPIIKRKFVTQFSALNRDPDFRSWFASFGGAALPAASKVFYNDYGWTRRTDPARTLKTYNKICSFMMEDGRYDNGATTADYGSDHNNHFYWPTTSWNHEKYDTSRYIDAVYMTCAGTAVSSKGEFWLYSNRGANTCYGFRCNPYPVPPADR